MEKKEEKRVRSWEQTGRKDGKIEIMEVESLPQESYRYQYPETSEEGEDE